MKDKCFWKKLFPLFAFFAFVVHLTLLSACTPRQETRFAPAAQVSGAVTDALGRQFVLGESPRRIVSLVPAATEILFAIGAGDRVVGVTQYCDYPPEAKEKTSVGGFSGATMSMEIIRSLEPDMVFLSADMHARVVSLLDELGISSFALEPRNISQTYDTITLLGEITGCVSGAESVIAEMEMKMGAVEERIRGRQPKTVFWVLGEEPIMTAGSGTFVSEAINLAGGKNIFDDVKEQWPLVSPEQVLLRNPDWVLIGSDMGEILSFSKNPLWQLLPVLREGRLEFIDADYLYRYGPRLADGVQMLAEILHGDL